MSFRGNGGTKTRRRQKRNTKRERKTPLRSRPGALRFGEARTLFGEGCQSVLATKAIGLRGVQGSENRGGVVYLGVLWVGSFRGKHFGLISFSPPSSPKDLPKVPPCKNYPSLVFQRGARGRGPKQASGRANSQGRRRRDAVQPESRSGTPASRRGGAIPGPEAQRGALTPRLNVLRDLRAIGVTNAAARSGQARPSTGGAGAGGPSGPSAAPPLASFRACIPLCIPWVGSAPRAAPSRAPGSPQARLALGSGCHGGESHESATSPVGRPSLLLSPSSSS